MELIKDILWFAALGTIFALVHLNPPSVFLVEVAIDIALAVALFLGFAYMHYSAHSSVGIIKRGIEKR